MNKIVYRVLVLISILLSSINGFAGTGELEYLGAKNATVDFCSKAANPLMREPTYQKVDIAGPLPYIRTYRATIANSINNQLEMIDGLRSIGGWTDNYTNYLIIKDNGARQNRLTLRVRLLGEQNESFFIGQTSNGTTLSDIIRIYSSIPLVQEGKLIYGTNDSDPTGKSSTNHRDKILSRIGGNDVLGSNISTANLTGYTFTVNQYGTIYTFKYAATRNASEVIYKITKVQKTNGTVLNLSYDNSGGLTRVNDNRGNTLYIYRYNYDSDPQKSLISGITLNYDASTPDDFPYTIVPIGNYSPYKALVGQNEKYTQRVAYTYNTYDWLDFRGNVWKKIYNISSANSSLYGTENYNYIKGGLDIFRSSMSPTDPSGVSYTSANYQVPILKSISLGKAANQPTITQVWNYAIYDSRIPWVYLTDTYQPLNTNETEKANYFKYTKGNARITSTNSNAAFQLELKSYDGKTVYNPMNYNISSDVGSENVTYSFSGYPCATYNNTPVKEMSVNALYGFTDYIVDAKGFTTKFGYDSIGRITTVTEAVGTDKQRITTYTYNKLSDGITNNPYTIPNKITAPGLIVDNVISGAGWVTEQTVSSDQKDSISKTTKYDYYTDVTKPDFGLIKSLDGPRTDIDDTKSFTYDEKGNISTETTVIGGTKRITNYGVYNDIGQTKSINYPNGTSKWFDYNVANQIVAENIYGFTGAGSSSIKTSYDYDALFGWKTSTTTPDGEVTSSSYNLIGLPLTVQYPDGNLSTKTYTPNGVLESDKTFNTNNEVVKASYQQVDANGRVSKIQQGNDATRYFEANGYDANGNLTQITTASGIIEKWDHDALNRVVTHTDGEANVDSKSYDLADNLISSKDALSAGSEPLVYRNGKLLTQETNTDFGKKTYSYNSSDQLSQRLHVNRQCDYNAIDSIGRYGSYTCKASTGNTTSENKVEDNYSYDQSRYGRLDKVSTGLTGYDVDTLYSYDNYDRVIQKTTINQLFNRWLNKTGQGLIVSYGYSPAGKITSMTLPSGRIIKYSYDLPKGQITGVSLSDKNIIRNMVYDKAGRLNSWQWGNTGNASYTMDYDTASNIKTITSKTNSGAINYSVDYGRDTDGRITTINRNNNTSDSFIYDKVDRLLNEKRIKDNVTLYDITYTYDKNGNRKSLKAIGVHQQPASNVNYTYTNNRLSSFSKDGTAQNISNTDTGELLYGSYKGEYDNAGRRKVDRSTSDQYYMNYNHKNERSLRAKLVNGIPSNVVQYIYDEQNHLIGEYDAGGTRVEYIWLDDKPIAAIYGSGAGNIYYIVSDEQNTPRRLMDNSDRLVWSWDSTAFGLGEPENGKPNIVVYPDDDENGDGGFTVLVIPPVTFNLRFPGQYADVGSKLFYNHNRYYNPELGRYMEADPIGLKGGLNPYVYAGSNPVNNVDPSGLIIPAVMYATGVILTMDSIVDGEPPAAKSAKAAGAVAKGMEKAAVSKPLGGAYSHVKGVTGNEAHHMPANSASPLSTGKGPAISMTKADHKQTASWGKSKEAIAYRNEQKQLIDNGKFKQAQQKDIDDVQSKFGTKYDDHMYQMRLYTDHKGY